MRIELITTGSELLLGFTVNRHLDYFGRQLATLGLRLARHTTVADDRAEMCAVVRDAIARSDFLLITGGLGPTSDDFTRDVVAELLRRPLVRDESVVATIQERFRRRGLTMPDKVMVQAQVPQGAQVLPNANGTAPGLLLKENGKTIVLLPGPPRELQPMFEQQVRPLLAGLAGFECRVLRTTGLPESIVEQKVEPVVGDVEVGYCARPGEVDVRLIGRDVAAAEQRIRQVLGDDIYGSGDDRLEEVVVQLLAEAGRTVATAESCTGGLMAHRLTNVSGSSIVFLGGWVTYSNTAKIRDLGVEEELLKQQGAVSEPVARAMADGARRRAGSDYALSATGVAGPTGGTAEKPVGLVYIGLATPTGTQVQRHTVTFDRETFKWYVSQTALDLLRRELLKANGSGLGQPALPGKSLPRPVGRAAPSAPSPRRKVLHHQLPAHVRPEETVFFLTICCVPRDKNHLCTPEIASAIFQSVETGQASGDWWMQLVVLMPDHLHALVALPSEKELRKVVTDWKKLLARKLGIRWQRDFFDHRIRKEENLQEKADYILHNPVRAGLVTRAEDWPFVWMPRPNSGGLGQPALPANSAKQSVERAAPSATKAATS